jgi:thiol:disulfide interchange protein
MCRYRLVSSLLVALALAGCDAAPWQPATVAAPGVNDDHAAPSQFQTDVVAALDEAARLHKPVLLYFTAEWCTYCRQLRREVLDRPEFQVAAERFVCVQVDADREAALCERYRVRAYPTLVLANPDGTAIERIVGLTTPTALLAQMNAAATAVVAAREERTETTLAR